MAFKGFKTAHYPVYTVITPQLGYSFEVRPLNIAELTTLRESILTRNKFHSVFNDILWKALVKKPDNIKTKTDFLNSLTLKDRDSLVYGLYYMTYGNEKVYNVECGACNAEQKIKINLNNIFNMKAYPGNVTVKDSYKIAKAHNPNLKEDKMIERAITTEEYLKSRLEELPKPPEGMPENMAREDEEFREYYETLDEFNKLDKSVFKINEDSLENNDDEIEQGTESEENNIEENIENNSESTDDLEEEYDETDSYIRFNFSEDDTEDFTPIDHKCFRVPLPASKGIVVYLKEACLAEEESISKNLGFTTKEQLDFAYDTLAISKIEEYDENNNLLQVIEDRIDIASAYGLLKPGDRKAIVEAYRKEFGQYEIQLKANWVCKTCRNKNILNLDIVRQFFHTTATT
jgi:hypothetical protein